MKNLTYLFYLLLFLPIISCSDNEIITTPISQNDLLGLWNVSNYNTNNGEANAYVNGQVISGSFNSYGTTMNVTSLFEETPNIVTTQGSFTINNTATFLGQSYNNSYALNQIPDFISSANWTLQDNVLTFSNQNQTILADIVYFRNDTLLLKTLFNKDLTNFIDYDITQQIDSLNFITLPIDSLRVKGELHLTLTR
tara:strand:- start:393 stop:980 length:588 start_codon:yes stop_codon:yes gene_type:complete